MLIKIGLFREHSPSIHSLYRATTLHQEEIIRGNWWIKGLVNDPWSSPHVELLREMMEDGSRAVGDWYVSFCSI